MLISRMRRHPMVVVLAVVVGWTLACGPAAPVGPKPDPTKGLTKEQKDEVKAVLEASRADYDSKMKALLKGWSCELDKVNQVAHCRPDSAPKYINSRTTVHAKVSLSPAGVLQGAYLQLNYAGDDWIFWESVKIRAGEELVTWDAFPRPERDHQGGNVGEWTTLRLDGPDGRRLSEVVARPGDVIVRFTGQRYSDHTVKRWERESIQTALEMLSLTSMSEADAVAAVLGAASE